MLLYYLDLVGVAVFAASGVLAARDRELDLLGMSRNLAFSAGMFIVVALRLVAIRLSLHLPVLRRPGHN